MGSPSLARAGGTLIDESYWAGYMDGEGCFQYTSTPMVQVGSTFPHVLIWLRDFYGGRLTCMPSRDHKRHFYRWTITGPSCREMVRDVMPYLYEKRPQAEILLQAGQYPKQSAMRAYLKRELTTLKRTNYTWTTGFLSRLTPQKNWSTS